MHEPIDDIIALFPYYKIKAYIIPSNDQYFSEYPSESAQRLKYMTNFSGTNGIAIICQKKGLFFTDGRYLEQSKLELDQNFFYIFNLNNLLHFPWEEYLEEGILIGYDPKLFTQSKLKIFSKIAAQFRKITVNLVDKIWINRPSEISSEIYIHPIEFAGQPYNDKIGLCRDLLSNYSATALIITALDSICWLLNLRANDIAYSPLLCGKVVITVNKVYLFTNINRVNKKIIFARPEVTIMVEENFENILLEQGGKILIDENLSSLYLMDLLNNKLIEKISDPCQLLKACKNNIEIKYAINSHIQDAIALSEFFAYLFESSNNLSGNFTEYTLAEILKDFRSKQKGYIMDSFPTICGFKENGAIIHYRALLNQTKKIGGKGLLLIDSGGQYKGGTTDVTRTLAIGKPTKEQKLRYTQVLKGHIALSMIKFPANNVTGANLEVLARQFLWKDYQDYPHSTGHGVGSFLQVHEGPQTISLCNNVTLKPGMIISNEPGYYKIGEFGIRIENLMYIKESAPGSKNIEANYLVFDTLTLVPYDNELIIFSMLNKDEKDYIKNYYKKIKQHVYPLLSNRGKKWIEHSIK